MSEPDDHQLLAEFARDHSEPAFAALVQRHVNLVYSSALRSIGNAHAAEEITQAVFIILARKAKGFSKKIVLSGWLYQTTRLTAGNFLRGEIRRQQREQEAYMQSTLNEPDADAWPQIAPLLDGALDKLGEADRNAIVLRFLENKSLREVGTALGASEDAAKMRVNRALEKLRKMFTKRGVTLTTLVIAGAVSANSVQAAPVGLAMTVTAAAAKGAGISTSTLTLIKGALKIMAWSKIKTAVVAGAFVLLATGTTVVVEKTAHPKLSATDLAWADDPKYWKLDSRVLNQLPSVLLLRPTKFPNRGGSVSTGQRALGINAPVEDLLGNAYGYNRSRTIFTSELPPGKYDYLMTPPYKPWDPLRGELKKQFGLVAHTERREMDVLQLQSRSADRPGLKKSSSKNTGSSSMRGEMKGENLTISMFSGSLESYFKLPVIDHSGLKGRYDMILNWKWQAGMDEAAEREKIKQALLDQLGLELVPARETLEVLIVEKAK